MILNICKRCKRTFESENQKDFCNSVCQREFEKREEEV